MLAHALDCRVAVARSGLASFVFLFAGVPTFMNVAASLIARLSGSGRLARLRVCLHFAFIGARLASCATRALAFGLL